LVWSLETAIKAAKGENIEEEGDLYKEIEVWKKNIKSEISTGTRRNDELVYMMYHNYLIGIFRLMQRKAEVFRDLFEDFETTTFYKLRKQESFYNIVVNQIGEPQKNKDTFEKFKFQVKLDGFIGKKGMQKDSITKSIIINLNLFTYIIETQSLRLYQNNYDVMLTRKDQEYITDTFISFLFQEIKTVMGNEEE